MQTVYYDLRDTKGPQRELEDKIAAAAQVLRKGGLVAIPTETVYGLGANGLDPDAVRRIFEAKGRPQDNPLILHITGPQWLPRYCKDIPPLAFVLTRKFWPGPLTLILKRNDRIPDIITAGLDTVAVRCPNHPVALALIREAGVPIAAPSANLSGRPSCTTAQAVAADMAGKIDGLVDGGPCLYGVESTILDLTEGEPRLLRPGGVSVEAIENLIGPVAIDKAVVGPLTDGERPKAPGMKYRHYAPKAPMTVFTGAPASSARKIAERARPGDGVLCFDEYVHLFRDQVALSLGPYADQAAQAQRLFAALRAFDERDVPAIYAQCPDSRGLGLAIGNRLKRAAGFHVVESDFQRIVLGITGGTGAGKTTALQAIRDMGGEVIDCDAYYHRLLDENDAMRNEINASFPGAFSLDGVLDRRRLGQEVFGRRDRMDRLNGIVFRYLVPLLEQDILSVEDGLLAVDAVNLLECGLDRLCDRTIAVTAPLELRVKRVMERDGIPENYARLRIDAQKKDEFYRGRCDIELNNTSESLEAFKEQAALFFRKLVEGLQEEKRHGAQRNGD